MPVLTEMIFLDDGAPLAPPTSAARTRALLTADREVRERVGLVEERLRQPVDQARTATLSAVMVEALLPDGAALRDAVVRGDVVTCVFELESGRSGRVLIPWSPGLDA